MIEPNQRFFENAEGLARVEANSSSTADKSVVRIDNVDRRLAVTIAHELTKRLDAIGATGRSYNERNFKLTDSLSKADRSYLQKNQEIFESTPALGSYHIEVKLPERTEMEKRGMKLGAYSVIAAINQEKARILADEPSRKLKEDLQKSYTSVFSRVDFFPTDEQKSIEKQLLELGVPVQTDTKEERELFEELEAADLSKVEKILRNIGVKEINIETLTELCEIRKWDAITVIDLYIEVMTEKQKKKHEFPGILLIDLSEHTHYPVPNEIKPPNGDSSMAQEIRRRQESQMPKRFAAIGLEEEEVAKRYELYEGDENSRLAFRFAAWLVSREFMKEESEVIAKRIRMGEKLPNPKLFKELTAAVYRVYSKFEADRYDNYNLGISWQKADYQKGHEYYRNMILLCLNIFHGKDISSFRNL